MQRIFRRQTWWSIHVIYKSCLGVFYVSKKASSLIPNLSMHGSGLLHKEHFIT